MRTRSLALLLGLVLATSAFAAPVEAPTTLELLNAAYRNNEIDFNDYALYKLYLVHEPERIPAQYQAEELVPPNTCGTPLIMDAWQALQEGVFDEEQAADAELYFLRPTDDRAQAALRGYGVPDAEVYHYDTPEGNFRIWWTLTGSDALLVTADNDGSGIPDYVEWIAEGMEYSLAFNEDIGWDTPPRDGDWYPDGADFGHLPGDDEADEQRWDVYIRVTGAMAYAQAEYYIEDTIENDAAGHMAFSRDGFDGESTTLSTAAHEFNHITQFGVDVGEPSHFMEKTSVFFEEMTYPERNAYQGNRVNGFLARPDYGLTREYGTSWYNSVIWHVYLESLARQDSRMGDLVDSFGQENSVIMAWEDYAQQTASRDLNWEESMDLIFRDAFGDTHTFDADTGAMGYGFTTFVRWNWFTGIREAHKAGMVNNLGYYYYDDDNPDENNPAAFREVEDKSPDGTREWTGADLISDDGVRMTMEPEGGADIYNCPDGFGSVYTHCIDLSGMPEGDVVFAFKANPENADKTKHWGGVYVMMQDELRQAADQDTEDDYLMHTFGDKGIIRVENANQYHELAFVPHVMVDEGTALSFRYWIRHDNSDNTPPSFDPSAGGALTIVRMPGFDTHFEFTATPNELLFACPSYEVVFTDEDGESNTYTVNGFQHGNDGYEWNDWDAGNPLYTAVWSLPDGIHGTGNLTVTAADVLGNVKELEYSDFLAVDDVDEGGGVIGRDVADAQLTVPAGAINGSATVSLLVRPDIQGGLLETRTLSSSSGVAKLTAPAVTLSRNLTTSVSASNPAGGSADEKLGLHVVGHAYDISSRGELAENATLRLRYDDAEVPNEDKLSVYRWNDENGSWERVAAQIDRQANEAYAAIDEFGVYAVGYSEMIEMVDESGIDQRFAFNLEQNYPNPYVAGSGQTSINFTTENTGRVNLSVYDISGRLVATVIDEDLPAGRHSVNWNGATQSGRSVESGVYFYKLETTDNSATRRMVIVR